MAKVLIVYYSQSGNTEALARAVGEGARSREGVTVTVKKALEANLNDLLDCDALAPWERLTFLATWQVA